MPEEPMQAITTALVALLALTGACLAQSPVLQPSPELSPEDVISIQLKALSETENNPATNSGVARVWAFAHPANRIVTGPIARFTQMLKSPPYRALIGHRSHHLRQVEVTESKAIFAVKVTDRDGDIFGYSWQLGKVGSGDYQGMWMTTGVSLIGKLGRAL